MSRRRPTCDAVAGLMHSRPPGVAREYFERVTLGSPAVMIALGLVFWAKGECKADASG